MKKPSTNSNRERESYLTAEKISIPLADLDYGEAEQQAVQRVLQSAWLTMGPETEAFESEFAAYLGVKHAVAVSSGTAALHLALLAAGIGPGQEVICPSLSFVATANAVRYCLAKPVLADVISLEDWTLSPADIESRITARTRVIMVMHYGGHACQMKEIEAIARAHDLIIVEDAAHGIGAWYGQQKLGSLGDLAAFSFFSNKNLAVGEGGMVVTDQEELAVTIRKLRSHGLTSQTHERHQGRATAYDVIGCGYNYRLDEIHSALGRVQLGKLDAGNEKRRKLAAIYQDRFRASRSVTVPFTRSPHKSNDHIAPILVPQAEQRDLLRQALAARGIQTSVHYRPIHTFSAYRDQGPFENLSLTEDIGARVVTLPMSAKLTPAQVHLVCDAIEDFFS